MKTKEEIMNLYKECISEAELPSDTEAWKAALIAISVIAPIFLATLLEIRDVLDRGIKTYSR